MFISPRLKLRTGHTLLKEREKNSGGAAQVHCENGDGVEFGQKKVFESGITGPEGHYLSRPYYLEVGNNQS